MLNLFKVLINRIWYFKIIMYYSINEKSSENLVFEHKSLRIEFFSAKVNCHTLILFLPIKHLLVIYLFIKSINLIQVNSKVIKITHNQMLSKFFKVFLSYNYFC